MSSFIQCAKNVDLGYAIISKFFDIQCVLDQKKVDMEFYSKYHKSPQEVLKESEVKIEKVEGEIVEETQEEKDEKVKSDKDVSDTVEPDQLRIVNPFKFTGTVDPEEGMMSDDRLDDNIDRAYLALSDIDRSEIKTCILSILYCAGDILPEQLYRRLDGNKMIELEMVNSMVKFFTGFTLTSAASSYMINEVFDKMKDLEQILMYECNYDDLPKNDIMVAELCNKLRDAITEYNRTQMTVNGIENPDPEVPFIIINKNLELNPKHTGLTKVQIKQLDSIFKEFIGDRNYQYNNINGSFIELVIYDNYQYDVYQIDPGDIFGNGINVLYIDQATNALFPINEKYKEVLKKIFDNKYYQLTMDDKCLISEDLFSNWQIYSNIDWSKGNEIFAKCRTGNDKDTLSQSLSAILNIPWPLRLSETEVMYLPRLRFRSFKGPKEFTLVSDQKVKLAAINGFNCWLDNDRELTISVNGNKALVKVKHLNPMMQLSDYERTFDIIRKEI